MKKSRAARPCSFGPNALAFGAAEGYVRVGAAGLAVDVQHADLQFGHRV
ncbi:hypothetical protein [Dactylosporangium sp. NPDC051484]